MVSHHGVLGLLLSSWTISCHEAYLFTWIRYKLFSMFLRGSVLMGVAQGVAGRKGNARCHIYLRDPFVHQSLPGLDKVVSPDKCDAARPNP